MKRNVEALNIKKPRKLAGFLSKQWLNDFSAMLERNNVRTEYRRQNPLEARCRLVAELLGQAEQGVKFDRR